jgi:hypothetical protein
MSLISNINKTLYAIKNKLINNDTITKSLFYSVANPLEQADLTTAQKESVVVMNPIVEYNTDPNNTINNFIAIGIPMVVYGDNLEGVLIRINIAIVCHTDYWELNNNRLRLMALAEEVFNELNEQKFSLSGKLIIDGFEPEIFRDNLVGYRLNALITDSDLDIELE